MKTKVKNIIIPLIPMALWGSLFPFIKIGYAAFSINTESIPDILMFAALRFVVCGVVVCALSLLKKEIIGESVGKCIFNNVILGLVTIVLHYAFTYIGLSLTESSKTAILKQLGSLLYVCFGFLFFKEEVFHPTKIIGALTGFAGIIITSAGGGEIAFGVGDIMIILASLCIVAGSVMSRKIVQGTSAFWVTGISQLAGGVILLVVAFALGASIPTFTVKSTFVFAYICIASIVAYTLWYHILRTNVLSKMFIFKFAEPLFACLFGALLLGEDILKLQYLVAFVLISLGITIGNRNLGKNEKSQNF